jgi:hypothetical protein
MLLFDIGLDCESTTRRFVNLLHFECFIKPAPGRYSGLERNSRLYLLATGFLDGNRPEPFGSCSVALPGTFPPPLTFHFRKPHDISPGAMIVFPTGHRIQLAEWARCRRPRDSILLHDPAGAIKPLTGVAPHAPRHHSPGR